MKNRLERITINYNKYDIKIFSDGKGTDFIDIYEIVNILIENYPDNKKIYNETISIIPSRYIEVIYSEGKEIILVDKCFLQNIARNFGDYCFSKWIERSGVNIINLHKVDVFSELLLSVVSKFDNIFKIKERIETLDNIQMDILHDIENENITEDEAFILYKKLKYLRKERRVVKNEFNKMQIIKNEFNKNYINKSVSTNILEKIKTINISNNNKIYNYRTDIEDRELFDKKFIERYEN
ncbi:MAG: hypothetical protein ACRC7S_13985 [Cetobacterium sp.]